MPGENIIIIGSEGVSFPRLRKSPERIALT